MEIEVYGNKMDMSKMRTGEVYKIEYYSADSPLYVMPLWISTDITFLENGKVPKEQRLPAIDLESGELWLLRADYISSITPMKSRLSVTCDFTEG